MKKKDLYFPNDIVECLIQRYQERGCTSVDLRNEIMEYVSPLIHKVIMTHNLHNIVGRRCEDDVVQDLHNIAWTRIEKILYKVQCGPGSSKCFNFFTQVTYTSILAYLKNNRKDYKAKDKYGPHDWSQRAGRKEENTWPEIKKAFIELADDCELPIIEAMEKLVYSNHSLLNSGLLRALAEESKTTIRDVKRFFFKLKCNCDQILDFTVEMPWEQYQNTSRDYESDDF